MRGTPVICAMALLGLGPVTAVAAPPATLRVGVTPGAAVAPGEWATGTVRVTNRAGVPRRGVVVTVRTTPGAVVQINVRPGKWASRVVIRSVRARGSATRRVRVRTSDAAARVTVSVAAAGVARRAATATQAPLPPRLEGRVFWHKVLTGHDDGLYFAAPGLAYRGLLDDGAFPTCAGVTAVDRGDGCVAASYTPSTGSVTVDGVQGTVDLKAHTMTLDGDTYLEAAPQPAGATFDADVFTARMTGLCPLYCNYYTGYLRLYPNGRFQKASVHSWTGSVSDGTVLPPNQQGAYAVLPGSLVRFTYDDGSVVTETLGVFHSKAGVPDPREGLLIGGEGYFVKSS